MKEINLTLTGKAKSAIVKYMSQSALQDPVASVQWSGGGWSDSEGALPPGWIVGFYDRKTVPGMDIQVIDGIQFVFEGCAKSQELNGKRLVMRSGAFEVV